MSTPITTPPTGVRISEQPRAIARTGKEFALGIRPNPNDPTTFENVQILVGEATATLSQAQQLLQNVAPADQVEPVLYAITGDWNTTGTDTTVYVQGLNPTAFASTGWVVDSTGKTKTVEVDVAAGTWFIVPANQQEAEVITHADLLAEFNNIGLVRQKWYRITDRPTAPNTYGTTVYFTDPANPTAWGVNGSFVSDTWQRYDLPSDTFFASGSSTPGGAPQWVAGPQAAGALVYDAGYVYRVKQAIANSQSAPGGNPANYLLVGPGGSGGSIPFTYTIQASDVTSPASDIVIAIPEALSFGMIYIEKPPVQGMDPLAPSNYSGAPGYLTIPASLSPALQAGDIVHIYYQEGTAASGGGGGVTPAELAEAKALLPFSTVTGPYTLQLSDMGTAVRVDSSSNVQVSVPAYADVPLPIKAHIELRQVGTGQVILSLGGGVAINSFPLNAFKTPGRYANMFLHKVDLNTWELTGGVV